MAKSKNYSHHNQNRKNHRNELKSRRRTGIRAKTEWTGSSSRTSDFPKGITNSARRRSAPKMSDNGRRRLRARPPSPASSFSIGHLKISLRSRLFPCFDRPRAHCHLIHISLSSKLRL